MLLWILNYKGTSLVISPAIINNGKVEYEKFHTAGKKVNRNTVFQVASLSKWISAFGIMKLVEDGRLDLDKPVSNYLSRWKLPEGEFNNEVTVRRLLSHTAGLTDGLGYSGFETVGEMQSLEQSLTMAADADSGITGKVQVGVIPGSEFKYSGGGYTLLQLIVEEVTNQSFALYMQEAVFKPLGMFHSTFIWNDSNAVELCEFYDDAYFPSKHRYYTSQAASGLYTSLADMELFFQAHFMGRNGEPAGRNVIKPATLKLMREIFQISDLLIQYEDTCQNHFIVKTLGSINCLNKSKIASLFASHSSKNGLIMSIIAPMMELRNITLGRNEKIVWEI